MPIFGYLKGQRCIFKQILCQEGFCSQCMIYLEKPQVIASEMEHKVIRIKGIFENILTNEKPQSVISSDE
jgi:hypothetical protein